MKALVTGGAGFIGSRLVQGLLESGWDVRVLDNFSTGIEESIPSESEVVRGDLRDLVSVRAACREIDVVFHQGAIRSVTRSVDEPVLVEQSNIGGTLNVLLGAEEAGVRRVVYASSSSVYGEMDGVVNREDMPTNPASPYGVSKLAGEHYCRVWTSLRGLSTVSLRYFNVFGPGQHAQSKYSTVFPAFISALLNGRAPVLEGDGEQTRDFTFIDDVVRANLLAAGADSGVDGQSMNIGRGQPRSVNEVLQAVSSALDRWIDPVRAPQREGDVRATRADISLARTLLGWEPTTPWEEAVDRTVEWFVAQTGSRRGPWPSPS